MRSLVPGACCSWGAPGHPRFLSSSCAVSSGLAVHQGLWAATPFLFCGCSVLLSSRLASGPSRPEGLGSRPVPVAPALPVLPFRILGAPAPGLSHVTAVPWGPPWPPVAWVRPPLGALSSGPLLSFQLFVVVIIPVSPVTTIAWHSVPDKKDCDVCFLHRTEMALHLCKGLTGCICPR